MHIETQKSDLTADDVVRELKETLERVLNLQPEKRVGGELRVPEPVMADHTTLIGISNRAFLQLLHGLKSRLKPGLHFRNELVRKSDPTHIQKQPELLVLVQPVNVPPPQRMRILHQPLLLGRSPIGRRQLRRDLPSHRHRKTSIGRFRPGGE